MDCFAVGSAPGVSAIQSLGVDPNLAVLLLQHIAASGKQLIFMSHGNLNMRKCSFSVCSLHDSDAERGPGVAQNRPVVCSMTLIFYRQLSCGW